VFFEKYTRFEFAKNSSFDLGCFAKERGIAMETAVIESPATSTDTSPPRTPRTHEEAALLAAWQASPELAIQACERQAASAYDSVEALTAEGIATGTGDNLFVGRMRQLLVARHHAVARLHFLSALSEGQPVDPLALQPDIDGELTERTIRARGASGFARLLAMAATVADAESSKAAALGVRLASLCEEFGAARITLGEFLESHLREDRARARHETRACALHRGIATAQAVLKQSVGRVLGDPASLRRGLIEAERLARRQDQELESLLQEASAVDRDLLVLVPGIDETGFEPGRITTALQSRKTDLAQRIRERREESIGSLGRNAGELVSLALEGDPGSLSTVAAVAARLPMAFQPDLSGAICDLLATSTGVAGDSFVSLL
jgi:hypothetical protein